MIINNSITTLHNLMNMKTLDGLKLITGKNGLSNTVEGCGLLDYEFDPELNDRYSLINYRKNLLIFSSLMFAKNQTWLISDTIRSLIAMGTSGMIIRNIYNIQLPNSILRYAESKSYPIFLIEDKEFYYEKIVRTVYSAIKWRESNYYRENLIDTILHIPLNSEEEKNRAYMLFPSLGQYYIAYFFRFFETSSSENIIEADQVISKNNTSKIIITSYMNHILLLCSISTPTLTSINNDCSFIIEKLSDLLPACAIGRSNIHMNPSNIRQAINESIQASLVQQDPDIMAYDKIGVYQILFSAISSIQTKVYSTNILNPITDYDLEKNGQLFTTLFEFVKHNGDLHIISDKLCIHENTLRQRLLKISILTGLDYRKFDDFEQLVLAVKIKNCIDWSRPFNLYTT